MRRIALLALVSLGSFACGEAPSAPPAIRTQSLGKRAAVKEPTSAQLAASATTASAQPEEADPAAMNAKINALFGARKAGELEAQLGGVRGDGALALGGKADRDVTQTQGASSVSGSLGVGSANGIGALGLRGAGVARGIGYGSGRGSGEVSYGASSGVAYGSGGLGNMSARDATLSADSLPAPGGTFAHPGVNPIVQTSGDRFSTFAIDVDTGSWFYAKRFLAGGTRPSPASVRVEELVNALHYSYEAPNDDAPFAIHVDAAPSPFVAADRTEKTLVRVALQGRRVASADRKAAHVVFLVDVSGSMSSADKLEWVRDGLHMTARALRADDSVAIVTYAGATDVVLASTRATERTTIDAAIDRLASGGGTNMGSGLELAYREATKELGSERSATVVVLSDGDANLGRTSYQEMLASIKGYVSEGVTMATVGFGSGNYNDDTMEQLADAGNGRYTYVGDRAQLQRFFERDLVDGIEVIAEDTKIQVEFVPERVSSYRLLGYENRDVADKDFRNDKKDAGEIFSGHAVTALYEVALMGGAAADEPIAYVRVRAKTPRHTKAKESERALLAGDVRTSVKQLDADARAALGMALAAEILRGSAHAKGKSLTDAAVLLESAATGQFAEERTEAARLMRLAANAPAIEVAREDGADLRGRRPAMTLGLPTVLGALDKELVRRVAQAHASQMQYCYEKELVRDPRMNGGKLVMKWVINGDGKVTQAATAETQVKNATVEACIATKIKTWVFPKPKGGGIAIVNFPFRFG